MLKYSRLIIVVKDNYGIEFTKFLWTFRNHWCSFMYAVFIGYQGIYRFIYTGSTMNKFDINKLHENLMNYFENYYMRDEYVNIYARIYMCKFENDNLFIDIHSLTKYCIFHGSYNQFMNMMLLQRVIKNPDTLLLIRNYFHTSSNLYN